MVAVCEAGGKGLFLPLFGDAEQEWPRPLRVLLYLVGLFWCFAGVAIIADVFMAGIEKVTSKKLRIWDKEKQRFYTFELWNATVANLTLMALGSSAPEILLNVIDIFAKDFYLEGLGPGTIVGSAAFNLEIIIAVCIVAIPSGQVRYIKETNVYIITACTSIFAYVWLLIILVGISPNVVEPWEGIVTFVFFPILVAAAWAADKGYFGGSKDEKKNVHADMTPEDIIEMEHEIRRKHGEHLTNDQVFRIFSVMADKPASRAAYRIGATRAMFGGKRIKTASKAARASFTKSFSFMRTSRVTPTVLEQKPICWVGFEAAKFIVLESAGHLEMCVRRTGDLDCTVKCCYRTIDGEAKAGYDFKAAGGVLEFAPGIERKNIRVDIIDDKGYEPDENFYVEVSAVELVGTVEVGAVLENLDMATVTIIDDDDPGVLAFDSNDKHVHASGTDKAVKAHVRRKGGGVGEITVDYFFEPDSALLGRDFEGQNGTLTFANGQMEAFISFTIKSGVRYDKTDRFRLVIQNPSGGATLDDSMDGGAEKNILTVLIAPDAATKDRIEKLRGSLAAKWAKSQIGHANWASQFKDAVFVNGGDDDDSDDSGSPSVLDYVTHYLTVPWKLLFAIVPPTDYCGGWACFFCALAMIGFVTCIIGDMASLLGCVLCLPDELTAITFVALGTSLPDTFASKTAAEQDPHADASVGNVTGSNCVNVFLGLGLPWMVASLHWATAAKDSDAAKGWHEKYQTQDGLDWLGKAGSRDVGFVVMSGGLGFSVAMFSCVAVLTVAVLAVRRRLFGGELGGPGVAKWASFALLIFFWLVYVTASFVQIISEAGGLTCFGK